MGEGIDNYIKKINSIPEEIQVDINLKKLTDKIAKELQKKLSLSIKI